MVEQATREQVDAFWSSTLDTSVADLHAPGVRVRANPAARREWRGIYVLAFEGATVYTPDDQVAPLSAALAGRGVDDVIAPETWQDLLGGAARTIYGPVRHYYRDHAAGLADVASGRRLNPTDAEALGALRAALPARDWVATGFTGQPAVLFGIFEGEQLVAAANLTPGPALPRGQAQTTDAATDIGVVIHPAARGRGYGLRITALAAKQAIAMYGLARYRALPSSPSTVAIADRLGFEQYGHNLVAYLNDQSTATDPPVV